MLLVVGALAFCAVAIVLTNIFGPTPLVSVPNLVGMSESRGVSIAKNDGLGVEVIQVHRTAVKPPHVDSVVAQYPTPGTHVSVGTRLKLTVYTP